MRRLFTTRQVPSWIFKIFYARINLVFERSILWIFAFLIWQNFLTKVLWPNGFRSSSKGLSHNWSWLTFAKSHMLFIGFAKHAVIYFKSYLSSLSFLVNLGYFLNLYPLPAVNTKVLYFLLLIYINDLLQIGICEFFSLCWWFM